MTSSLELRHLRTDLVYRRPMPGVSPPDPWHVAARRAIGDVERGSRNEREQRPIRVLVIDDSAFSRQAITRMLEASPLVEVVGVARDGEEALRKTLELEPDLITVDLEMPKMDGFTFLRIVMSKRPTPVIVISGRTGEDDVFKALELGAVDFIAKPTPHATPMLAIDRAGADPQGARGARAAHRQGARADARAAAGGARATRRARCRAWS